MAFTLYQMQMAREYRAELIKTLESGTPREAKQAAIMLHKQAMMCLEPLTKLGYCPDLFYAPTRTIKLFKQAFKALEKII